MGTVAECTELESRQLKFEPLSKVLVAILEVRWHSQEEGITLHGCDPSLALRSSAKPACGPVQVPASLAPPTVKRFASRCARAERREWKVSILSALKRWRRIERSNTMLQRAQSPARSSEEA